MSIFRGSERQTTNAVDYNTSAPIYKVIMQQNLF